MSTTNNPKPKRSLTKSILFVAFELIMLAGVFFCLIEGDNDHFNVNTQIILPYIAIPCGLLFIGGIWWYAATNQQN